MSSKSEPPLANVGDLPEEIQAWVRWAQDAMFDLKYQLESAEGQNRAMGFAATEAKRKAADCEAKVAAYERVISARQATTFHSPGSWVFTGEGFKVKALVLSVTISGANGLWYKLGYWTNATWNWVEVPESQVSLDQPLAGTPPIGFTHNTSKE